MLIVYYINYSKLQRSAECLNEQRNDIITMMYLSYEKI